LESYPAVTSIAEGLILGMPATAKGDDFPTGKIERITFHIKHREISLYFERAVVVDDNFGIWHRTLLETMNRELT